MFLSSYSFCCLVSPPATRLPTPETAFSLCAGISGNGGQGATLAGQLECRGKHGNGGQVLGLRQTARPARPGAISIYHI